MNSVFADTWFFLAALNRADANHARALAASRADRRHRVTTDWILVEVGGALCRGGNRDVYCRLYDWVHQHPATTIVLAARQLLVEGTRLFRNRPDKDWPLTDCISFIVMEDEGIGEALTADRHFEQAGFTPLLT